MTRPETARRYPPLSSFAATRLVATREVSAQLRSKSFIITSEIMLVAVLAAIVLGSVFGGGDSDPVPVAVTAQTEPLAAANPLLDPTVVPDEQAARTAVQDGTVDAAILASNETSHDPLGFYVVGLDSTPADVVAALSAAPRVELLEPPTTSEALQYLVALAFGLIFMIAAITFGSTIAQNTVVEKQTRTVEILLSAVPARTLLAGKILGNSVLAIGQTACLVLAAALGLMVTGQGDILEIVGAPVLWYVAFFIVGFVLLASIYAGSAALVSRMEDTGAVLTPVTWLVMIPYFVAIFFTNNDVVMTIASYVPFSAPVAMPLRVFMGTAQWWEPIASLVLLAFSAWLTVRLGAKIYERTILRMGSRVKLKEALAA